MLSVADSSLRAPLAPERKRYARTPEVHPIPNLIELQLDSFRWFIEQGLRELFEEISPIQDFTGRVMELRFGKHEFGEPKYTELECRSRDLTYAKPLYVDVELHFKETGDIQGQRVYMGAFPTMTGQGTFIINGAERVVVSQLVRSPGVYYTATEDPATGRKLFSAKVIPNRGAWLEFETTAKQNALQLWVKGDRKRKLEATKLLRAVGYEQNEARLELFRRVDTTDPGQIAATLEKDTTSTRHEALIEVYKKLRPGGPPTGDNAEKLVESLFFNFRRYDLGRVGRYKVNKKLDAVAARMGIELPRTERTITREDIAAIVGHLIELNNDLGQPDDIDPLGNRRIRANGELIQNAFRIGLLRMERVVKERMTIQEIEKATPNALIHIRPVVAAGRAGEQAAPPGPRPRRPLARARRLRRPRRPPQPLRPDLPHRDARGPEHRPHRLARHLRPHQRVRLHRDPLPQGEAQHELGRSGDRARDRRRRPRRQVRHGRPQEGGARHEGGRGRAEEAEGRC